MKKIIIYICCCLVIAACSDDKLGDSILSYEPTPTNELDKWVEDNIRSQYNIGINYRWEDIESDLTYNLIPADYDKSYKLARLVKFLWLEAYDELTGSQEFMSTYAPKLLQFVGSPAVDPNTQTIVLGTAEGGLKVTLYYVNSLDLENPDIEVLNEYYFKTMHHEFAHILHQTKDYPRTYNDITPDSYSSSWYQRSQAEAWSLGYVSNYASKAPEEDFVEMIANYVVQTEAWWQNMLNSSITNKEVIERKFEIVKEWLDTAWDIDIDELRNIVARRSLEIDSI